MKYKSKWAKKCSVCGKGLRSHNKSLLCEFHYRKEYRKKPEVRERDRKYAQIYRENNKEKVKEYYIKHKDEITKRNKEHYIKNKDKRLKKQKEYYEKNKDEILKKQRRYRARKKLQAQLQTQSQIPQNT